MRRCAIAGLLLASLFGAPAGAETLSISAINFGTVQYGTLQKFVGTATFTCTSGASYSISPGTSFNSNAYYALTGTKDADVGGGSAGYGYFVFERTDGTILNKTLTSSWITGTCTGGVQTATFWVYLSNDSTGATPIQRSGTFSASPTALLKLTASSTVSAGASVSAYVRGSCSVFTGSAALNFGNIAPGVATATQSTTFYVTCTNGLSYTFYPDDAAASGWTLAGTSSATKAVSTPPGVTAQVRLNGYPAGPTYCTSCTWVGTGGTQSYPLDVTLTIPNGFVGQVNASLSPQVRF